jgi:glycosyltransferase involved in cell wall biosynthesis
MIKLDKTNKTTIIFVSWRDIEAPKKGGAEVYTHEMLKRVDHSKYRIIHISPEFENSKKEKVIENIQYLRMGKNAISVIFEAEKFYKNNKENIDYVVDQCNTHRFFTRLWVPAHKRIFFIHQFTREIWYLNSKVPVSTIGYYTETPFLRLSRNDYTITVSESTKKDLLAVGFDPEKVFILPEGIDFVHWDRESFLEKEQVPTFIYVGRFVNYKGIDDTVKAFSEIKLRYSDARLWIVGKKNQQYIDDVLKPLLEEKKLSYGDEKDNHDIVFFGFVSEEKKLELMSRAHALIFPSQREGWGLIITEAAAVGTPSIGYNSPGIVDAVDFGHAGYLCSNNNVENIVKHMEDIIADKKGYEEMREKAYEFSLKFHWGNTATAFNNFMEMIKKH